MFLARFLQWLGFSEVTLALIIGLSSGGSMGLEMAMMIVGIIFFFIGRQLEMRQRP